LKGEDGWRITKTGPRPDWPLLGRQKKLDHGGPGKAGLAKKLSKGEGCLGQLG